MVHQGVARVEQQLDCFCSILLLAFGDILLGEQEVVDDAVGRGPGAEQVIALEERVVPVAGVGDHQRLHGQRVLFHEVRDAGTRVDNNLVCEAHLPTTIPLFVGNKLLAKRPMVIADGHTDGRVCVHHLLGSDDLDLVGVYVEAEVTYGDVRDLGVEALDQWERPF